MGGGHTHTAEETTPGGANPAWLARPSAWYPGSTVCCLCVSASSMAIDVLWERLGCEVIRLRSV